MQLGCIYIYIGLKLIIMIVQIKFMMSSLLLVLLAFLVGHNLVEGKSFISTA